MSVSRRLLIRLFMLFSSFAALLLVVDLLGFLYAPLSTASEGLDYQIAPGASVRMVAADLAERGLLSRPRYFIFVARFTNRAERIKAGEYSIDPRSTPMELLEQFAAGRVKQHSLTIVEGWTFRQLMQVVNTHPALDPTLDSLTDSQIMERLDYAGRHPEGRFLPDTYSFPRGTTDVAFLRRAHRAMDKRLASEWQTRVEDLPLDSPYQALILASIVERETAIARERSKIAGVFIERLKKGMRLQTDPTVIYGLGEEFTGDLRYRDLRRDTPYNTYVRKGLPPTPIAMPGAAAIHAALHPESTGALFFVARGDGSHAFSRTLKEHNAAVVKYQLRGDARRLKRD